MPRLWDGITMEETNMPSITGIFSRFGDAKQAATNITRTVGISMDQMNLLTPGASEAELAAVPRTDAEQPGVGKAFYRL